MEDKYLEQAKKRNAKVKITEIAIEKVPLIKYKGFTEKQNKLMRELAKTVLSESMLYNDSNEVAITFDLALRKEKTQYAITYGTENAVDICADTLSNHILRTAESATVVILHNHPSTKTFSLDDLKFFLNYVKIKLLVVVSNQGIVHYIMKDVKFDFWSAAQLYGRCVKDLNGNSTLEEIYDASLLFLSQCSKVGLFYI